MKRRRSRKRSRRYRRKAMPSIQSTMLMRYKTNAKYGQETKTCDYNFGIDAVPPFNYQPDLLNFPPLPINNATNNVQALNLVTEGPGLCQRVGNKISCKSIRLRLYLIPTGNQQLTWSRLMIVYDRQTNGMYPPTNQILSRINAVNTLIPGVDTGNIDINSLERYLSIMDTYKSLPAFYTAATTRFVGSTNNSAFIVDKFIKLRGLETLFKGTMNNGNPEVIADVITGGLYLISYSELDATDPMATTYLYSGDVRFRFQDN